MIDIYSRKIVAWSIDTTESDKVAKHLITRAREREGITRAREREGINPDELILHSDRGAQMTSHTIAELLEDGSSGGLPVSAGTLRGRAGGWPYIIVVP